MKLAIALLLALTLSACATQSVSGKIYAIAEKTTVLEFTIVQENGTKKMTAKNPDTGENFSGECTSIVTGYRPSGAAYVPPARPATNAFARGVEQGAQIVANTPVASQASARAILIGDKGTTIQLTMDVSTGPHPHGHGEGTDNKGVRYQIQF